MTEGLQRLFRVYDLDCKHRLLTAKYEHKKGEDGWPVILCEECKEWSVGHTIETVTA